MILPDCWLSLLNPVINTHEGGHSVATNLLFRINLAGTKVAVGAYGGTIGHDFLVALRINCAQRTGCFKSHEQMADKE
jgi:hypothetical protein